MVEAFDDHGAPDLLHRREGLIRLKNKIVEYRESICEAMRHDFAKPAFEADASETLIVLREIHTAIRSLRYWMQKRSVDSDILLPGSNSFIRYEPRGVVLIMSPWNYPINLSLSPLVAAYAAGNRIILKPSELSSHTSAIIHRIVSEAFDPKEVCVLQGGAEIASYLTSLPFHFIFYTGSQSKAKLVLASASQNLTPVATELGGKSPLIIDEGYPIASIAGDICFGKLLNAGQTCVAPDFILLHKSQEEDFIHFWKRAINSFYGEDVCSSSDYCGIINEDHFTRLIKLVESAIQDGAVACDKIEFDTVKRKIRPVLLKNVSWQNPVMQEEIFGPILPILCYDSLDEIFIPMRTLGRPLTQYIYCKNSTNLKKILDRTRAGGVSINQCLLNYCENNLPFGGDHQSGSGRYHGYSGFVEFSHQRSVARQRLIPSAIRLFHPPYQGWKKKMINILIRFFAN